MDEFLLLGGDRRLSYTAQYLADHGHRVLTALSDDIEDQDDVELAVSAVQNIVLPLPAFQDGVFVTAPRAKRRLSARRLFYCLKPGQRLFGGQLGAYFMETLRPHGVEVYDYYQREELAVANAVPTAEGALAIALRELPVTIRGLSVLVLGYGRVGKACARLFAAAGAHVTVAARRQADRAWIQSEGFGCLDMEYLRGALPDFRAIINTVPAQILGESLLERLRPDCLLVELASKPWGIDRDAAERLGLRLIQAPGLPGKQAPETAGQAIGNCILTILSEIRRSNE